MHQHSIACAKCGYANPPPSATSAVCLSCGSALPTRVLVTPVSAAPVCTQFTDTPAYQDLWELLRQHGHVGLLQAAAVYFSAWRLSLTSQDAQEVSLGAMYALFRHAGALDRPLTLAGHTTSIRSLAQGWKAQFVQGIDLDGYVLDNAAFNAIIAIRTTLK